MTDVQDRPDIAISEALHRAGDSTPTPVVPEPLAVYFLPSEHSFYCSYSWCLNAYPTVGEVVGYLREELNRLDMEKKEEWHAAEMMTNIFLLACAITNEVDDYLVGNRYDFGKLAKAPFGRFLMRAANGSAACFRRTREWQLQGLRVWREEWQVAVAQYLDIFLGGDRQSRTGLPGCKTRIIALLRRRLPGKLLARRLRNPAFFHGRELTHFDVLQLGDKFISAFPDRKASIVLVGLRTAGSYFAPLLQAYLKRNGYVDLHLITIRPRSPLSAHESARLTKCAGEERTAVIVDESPIGGGTTARVIKMLQKRGYGRIVALLPIHRLYRDWQKGWDKQRLSGVTALTLEPDEWHKKKSLTLHAVEAPLKEYFKERGYLSATVRDSAAAEAYNQYLQHLSSEKMHTRHKRIYEVVLHTPDGTMETRYVLAKSVGWGWLAYRAFLVSERLAEFVPPVLGLRNGFLFMEWRPQGNIAGRGRAGQLEDIAMYIAARVRCLGLDNDPSSDLLRSNQHGGYEQLADVLLGAYASRTARFFKRPAILRKAAQHICPFPTLIDAKMHPSEWITERVSRIKTDFEHHSMGKAELEITDPAYDLAEAILHFKLSREEEQKLISRYVEQCGDKNVGERLFLHKLLAGTWSMRQALLNLTDEHLAHRYQEFNQRYLDAAKFLTSQTMRFCAGLCQRPKALSWRSPIVALDIDGVVDRLVFGFPSTTGAGIRAISLLHAHDFATVLDTARSVSEVQEYCRAYGFLGGVAEYGSAIWDAVSGQERSLVSREALRQLDKLRHALRKVPGVFLNNDYEYSIRAYTFNAERTVALPTMLIQHLISSHNLDRLRFHQTSLDTAVLAKDVDKGKGLLELLNRFIVKDSEIIAIGDSEPDLAMFRVATRSFSPSHIWCRSDAEALGCRIAANPYQLGFLESVRSVVHSDDKQCESCRSCRRLWPNAGDFFLQLLDIADQKRIKVLVNAIVDPFAVKAFAK